MSAEIIFDIGLVLFSGLLFGRLAKFVKLPNVTGYLIAGLLLGPSVLNLIPATAVDHFGVVSDMALGFIAFSIGSEFKMSYFKQVGMTPIIIAITESCGAILLVTFSCILFGFDTRLSILLGAIAAATAPAQTIMVVQQYGAKGPVTSMLLSVVALDDAVALIGFGFATTIVTVMESAQVSLALSLLKPLYEVAASFVLGGGLALLMVLFLKWFKKPSNRLCVTIAFVFAAIWIADVIQASPLLTCMALGTGLVNMFDHTEDVIKVSNAFTPPLFMVFFVISGAGFQVSALAGIGLIGILYVVMRVAGKMLGAWFGGVVTKSDKKISKYLGPMLMPQAGVALGLLMVAEKLVPHHAATLRVIILCSTFIYSLVGPSAAKAALEKANEIVLPKKHKQVKENVKS